MKKMTIKLTVRRETIRRLAKHDAVGDAITTCTGDTKHESGCTGLA